MDIAATLRHGVLVATAETVTTAGVREFYVRIESLQPDGSPTGQVLAQWPPPAVMGLHSHLYGKDGALRFAVGKFIDPAALAQYLGGLYEYLGRDVPDKLASAIVAFGSVMAPIAPAGGSPQTLVSSDEGTASVGQYL